MGWKPANLVGTSADWTIVDSDTLARVQYTPPALRFVVPAATSTDELLPIAIYMAGEFNTNAAGDDAKRMRQLNSVSLVQCIADFQSLPAWQQFLGLGVNPSQCADTFISAQAAALLIWGWNVRQNGPWDHKPKIAARFHPRNPGGPQHWHLRASTLYYYDVWSNLHYGYVGAACGFSADTLLDGAGVEQVGSNWARFEGAHRTPGVSGMRAFDAPEDRYAIEQGFQLHGRQPSGVTPSDLVNLVVQMAPHITTRKHAP